ncbi:MAG: glycosyl hydrolase family 65 protein [Candidatus Margulisiibacteriota bacterium]
MSKKLSLSPEDWLIKEEGYRPQKQGMYESLFTLGNGYLGVRGSLEENPHGSYRGVYIAGIFDKSEAYVSELVKAPGWTDFSVWIDDHKFGADSCKALSHERVLDMRKGILHRITRFKCPQGRILRLETKRVVFAHQVRGAVIDVSLTPENFSGEIKVLSGLNGDVTNEGYFPYERIKHLNLVSMQRDQDHVYLETETRDNKIRIAMAANTLFDNPPAGTIKVSRMFGEKFAHKIIFKAEKNKTYHFTKWVTTFTTREGYERQLQSAATDLLHDMVREGLDYHLKKHLEVREKDWEQADVLIKGDRKAQKGIRFNLYHLIIAKPHHDPTVSVGAKFLTGEGYKGHAFWDTEIFILPFYNFTFPEEARNLLMYRYYTLKGAMKNAKDLGYKGAKFAWESAGTGVETTPSYGLRADGSAIKIFTGEEEHHIVSDVVYGIYKYVGLTGDVDFLYEHGAEVVFQTARFWLSRVEKRRDRYEVRKVIGPDEFHEHVDNNAFTSYLAMRNLSYAADIYKQMKKEVPEHFKALVKKIKLKAEEIEKMKIVSKTIFFPYDQKTELIEQFEGYFTLEDHKIKELDKNGLPKYPKGVDKTNLHRTQLVKQADVVLLLYLFLDRFSAELEKKNYEYYEARTMHKSSLSPCIYALMGLETGDHKRAYNYFIKTSYIDLVDASKNTKDGIHAAATGGAWMTAIHGFAGMKVRRGELCFDPWLPKKWQELSYTSIWKGNLLRIKVTHKSIVLQLLEGKSVSVNVQGKAVRLKSKRPVKVRLKKKY